ncbi:MAG: hypothetical protein ABIM73_06535 [Arenimonas sp.]
MDAAKIEALAKELAGLATLISPVNGAAITAGIAIVTQLNSAFAAIIHSSVDTIDAVDAKVSADYIRSSQDLRAAIAKHPANQ